MTGPNGEQCRECLYYEQTPQQYGLCHRFPPQPHPDASIHRDVFSDVDPDEWCGEFKRLERP